MFLVPKEIAGTKGTAVSLEWVGRVLQDPEDHLEKWERQASERGVGVCYKLFLQCLS